MGMHFPPCVCVCVWCCYMGTHACAFCAFSTKQGMVLQSLIQHVCVWGLCGVKLVLLGLVVGGVS